MNISVSPYAVTAEDRSAIVQGMKVFTQALKNNPEIDIVQPPANVTIEDYVANVSRTASIPRKDHVLSLTGRLWPL